MRSSGIQVAGCPTAISAAFALASQAAQPPNSTAKLSQLILNVTRMDRNRWHYLLGRAADIRSSGGGSILFSF